MIFSGLALNAYRKKQKQNNNDNFQDTPSDLGVGVGVAIGTTLIITIIILILMLVVCICAIVKASKVCGQDTALHIILILFIPFYALIFCFAGNSICKNNRPRSRSVSRR